MYQIILKTHLFSTQENKIAEARYQHSCFFSFIKITLTYIYASENSQHIRRKPSSCFCMSKYFKRLKL